MIHLSLCKALIPTGQLLRRKTKLGMSHRERLCFHRLLLRSRWNADESSQDLISRFSGERWITLLCSLQDNHLEDCTLILASRTHHTCLHFRGGVRAKANSWSGTQACREKSWTFVNKLKPWSSPVTMQRNLLFFLRYRKIFSLLKNDGAHTLPTDIKHFMVSTSTKRSGFCYLIIAAINTSFTNFSFLPLIPNR